MLRWRQDATSPLTIATPAQLTSCMVPNWSVGKPADFDLSVTSPLNLNILLEAGVTAGAELRKHEANDGKCRELGWVCVPMVVEATGAWGAEAMESLSCLASRLATSSNKAKAAVLNSLYGRLNLNLVKANATAMLSRCFASDIYTV